MRGRPIRVLIVEDNEADVNLTLAALWDGKASNEIQVAQSGEEATAYLRRAGRSRGYSFPDLVLLDLNLPNKGGFEVLAEMKADPNLRSIPVVVISGSDQDGDVARAYNLQAAAYLIKPLNVDDYFSAIRAIKELWFNRAAIHAKGAEAGA
jgi:two-component system, chemotaxis family, response regulator Rcp1